MPELPARPTSTVIMDLAVSTEPAPDTLVLPVPEVSQLDHPFARVTSFVEVTTRAEE